MKRDFQEEYQNYIESDMPDLWSRIEPNLKEREGKAREGQAKEEKAGEGQARAGKARIVYFMKRAVPAAACLCALFIGIGVLGISKSNSADKKMMESASGEPQDAGMEYEYEAEAAGEEAVAEVYEEPAAQAPEEEAVMMDEGVDKAAGMDEDAAFANDFMPETQGAEMGNGSAAMTNKDETDYRNSMGDTGINGKNVSEEAVSVEYAVLSGIAAASAEMQEEGYAYVYTFRLEDNSRLKVYLTKEQCRDLEEREVEIKRQEAYSLSVFPVKTNENTGNTAVGEGFLENLEKLP